MGKNVAIVTGASSGMGKDFVRLINKEYSVDEIWVIARRREMLEELKKKLGKKIRILPLDLTDDDSIEDIEELLEKEKPRVSVLVNAAGFGKFGEFTSVDLDDYMDMTELNSMALVAMTYRVLPYMDRGSEIYQLGSLSAFQPVPYIAVYGATKAYVLSFSRALNREIRKKKGIKVMAVCPGWVKTEFFNRAVKDDTISYYNRFFTSEEVVSRAFYDMKRGKDLSVCGFTVRAQVLLTKLLPHRLVMNIWCRQQKK